MTVTATSINRRPAKAALLVGTAESWLKCRTPEGAKFYGVPSAAHPGQYHLTNQLVCSCPDFQTRGGPCYHVLAVRLHCARKTTIDGRA